MRSELTDYAIAAYHGHYLRSWVVEGSEDVSTWAVLDAHQNDTVSESNAGEIAPFSVKKRMKCRFIRLLETGKSADNREYLCLLGFEAFGLVHAPIYQSTE
jgi:hypothetical protein